MLKHLVLLAFAATVCAGAQPFDFAAGRILFPVTINGVGPYPCVLDLLAEGPVLASDAAHFLDLKAVDGSRVSRQGTSGRDVVAEAVVAKDVEGAGGSAHDVTFAAMDLSGFTRLLGAAPAGIMSGREFSPSLQLDVRAKTLSFGKPETLLQPTGSGVVSIQLTPSGAPLVSAAIDGKHVRSFLLDTTLRASMSAPESVLRDLGVVTDETPRLVLDAPPGAAERPGQTQLRLKSVRVGGAQLLDPICAISPQGQPARLGLGFLRHFRVQIDYAAKLLWLEPHSAASIPHDPPLTGYGVGLWKFNGTYCMINVAQGSPAAKAGLVSGAILIAIGEKDVRGLGHDAVITLLEPHAGAKIKLTVVQGDDKHTVELAPEKLL